MKDEMTEKELRDRSSALTQCRLFIPRRHEPALVVRQRQFPLRQFSIDSFTGSDLSFPPLGSFFASIIAAELPKDGQQPTRLD